MTSSMDPARPWGQVRHKKNLIEFKILIEFKRTSNVLFETFDSYEKRFDFGWNRTRATRVVVCSADHSATRPFFSKFFKKLYI